MIVSIDLERDNEDDSLIVFCNGESAETSADMSRTRQSKTECGYSPLGWNSPAFVVGKYLVLDQAGLRVFYQSGHKASAESFQQAAEKVKPFIAEWFGSAKKNVVVADLADPGAAPFEAGRVLLTPFSATDPKLLQIAMAHELTHSAFASPRAWIAEGLAHFAQAVYRERQDGREAALDFMGLHRSAIVEVEKSAAAPGGTVDRSLAATSIEEFYRSKAAYVWWMLRDMLGDDVLQRALAAYHPDEDNDPRYMQKLLEKISGRELQWFFDSWVYQDRGLADFRVASAFARRMSGGNYVSTVTVENLGAPGAEVPVTVRFEDDDVTQRIMVSGNDKAVIRIETPRKPMEVIVNDGSVPESDLNNNTFKITSTAQ
jgi:hypothetical protein